MGLSIEDGRKVDEKTSDPERMKRLLTVAVGVLFLCLLSHGPAWSGDKKEKENDLCGEGQG
jgi:hypothetical protein